MKILWNGEDITRKIDVSGLVLHDRACGSADSIDILLPDPDAVWTSWKPIKGDIIEASEGDFSSGVMYFDGWELDGKAFKAMAISTPPVGKSAAIRSWDNATFSRVASDIAWACGMELIVHDIMDYTYDRVDQIGKGNLEFLNWLCVREGYTLKITNSKAVIFKEKAFEQKDSVRTVHKYEMIGSPVFKSFSADLKSACTAKYFSDAGALLEYKAIASGVYGGDLRIDEHLTSIGEAERFTKSALRQANKYEYTGYFRVKLDPTLAAAACIDIDGFGAMDGKWYMDRVAHDISNGSTYCSVRKPIEGDY